MGAHVKARSGRNVRFREFKVVNMMANGDAKCSVAIAKLAQNHRDSATWVWYGVLGIHDAELCNLC